MILNQMPQPETPVLLSDRRLVHVSGVDARDFLQNIMSNDVDKTADGALVYSLLLTPQGQFLHDFFVLQDVLNQEGYLLDIHQDQVEEFLKRMVMFKLRAKVTLTLLATDACFIYSPAQEGTTDPRLPALGKRLYSPQKMEAQENLSLYHDTRIALGVADGSRTVKAQKDFPADMNFDHLHALGWDKGCFIGQEVVARMYHRGLAKKRLVIITGEGLETGDILSPAGRPVGEVRETTTRGDAALALLRLDNLTNSPAGLTLEKGVITAVRLPDYLNI